MKKICYLMLGLLFMACSDGSEKWSPGDDDPDDPSGGGEETVIYHQRAKEMFDLVQRYYKHGNSGLYKESFPSQSGDPEYSFLWPYDGLVSSAALLTQLGYDVGYPEW